MARGRLITLEGGEGTGKSTQAARLGAFLRARGHNVVLTREPGGTPLAESIRALVLAEKPAAASAEFLLFAAARSEHITAVVAPALERGDWVVCDRYIDSTRVYQGDVGGIRRDLIMAIEQFCVAPWFPDLTLVLDVPVHLSEERVAARGALSRFDTVDGQRHERIREGFLAIAEQEPERCEVIPADGSPETVAMLVEAVVTRRLLTDRADNRPRFPEKEA